MDGGGKKTAAAIHQEMAREVNHLLSRVFAQRRHSTDLEAIETALRAALHQVGAAALHFLGAIQIVDLYHARQHRWELARRLYPNDEGKQRAWMKVHQKRLLDKGKIEKLVGVLRAIKSRHPEAVEKIRTEADYFERNAERMRYPNFRRQRLFVGSGVIEAGCKTVIASRLKQSGMFWTVRGSQCHPGASLFSSQWPL